MRKLSTLFEEVIKEYSLGDDIDYELYQRYDDYVMRILQLFLEENNEDYTIRMPWRLIPYPRLKRIWEEWAKFGFVRDVKGLEIIENIMISNTIKIHVMTMLSGHTPESTDKHFEDAWGPYIDEYIKQYITRIKNGQEPDVNNPNQLEIDWDNKSGDGVRKKISNEEIVNDPYLDEAMEDFDLNQMDINGAKKKLIDALQDRFFWYYIDDPEAGHMRISDYGLEPLIKLMSELRNIHNTSGKVVIIDKMLNVVHQRSDIAAWYVKGGSNALSDLSSSPSEKQLEK